jgi:TolA-binding protein
MTRRWIAPAVGLFFLATVVAARVPESPGPPRLKRAAAARPGVSRANDARRLEVAKGAYREGRIEEARQLLKGIDAVHLPRGDDDECAYLAATVAEEADENARLLDEYLKNFPKGNSRRAATFALAKNRFARGDYREAENLLSVFSPGVEQDAVGREGLVWRGLSQLGRGDAAGASQLLKAAKHDLDASPQEPLYYFATAQAALRGGRPQEAVAALQILLERYPRGDYAPQALYALGVSLESMGRAADATAVFRQMAQRFPDSYEATRARDRGIRAAGAPGAPAVGIPAGGGFAIQVGAFTRRDLADALGKDLRGAGVGDVSIQQGRENPPIFRVRAGSFATRDEARALGERLRRERGFSYNVVTR